MTDKLDGGAPSTDGTPVLPDPVELMPGLAALLPLAIAAKSGDKDQLAVRRADFELHNGVIKNSYFALRTNACALLVEQRPEAGKSGESGAGTRRLMIWLDRRDVAMRHSPFLEACWRTFWLARRAEHERSNVLTLRTRNFCLDMLFDVAVSLLGVLDSVASTERATDEPLRRTALIANLELDRIEQFAERGAIHRTFRHYLMGLPAGALLLAAPIFVTEQLLPIPEPIQHLIALCIIGGGVGAMTSVMVRITRGQKLSVDVHQGGFVTFLAGVFRPVIGAVFGVSLYALLVGGLLPIAVDQQEAHFFGGLSFLAGFSERWAQDMIVRSAPVAPSPATTAGRRSVEEGPRTSDERR